MPAVWPEDDRPQSLGEANRDALKGPLVEKRRLTPGVLASYCTAAVLTLGPLSLSAQTRDSAADAVVAFTGAGLVSVQPVDGTYVGPRGPYLDEGLGGIGPGLLGGVTAIVNGRLVLTGEFSTTWIDLRQTGRLVPGGAATGRLRDTLLTGLIGAHLSSGTARIQLLTGLSRVVGSATSGGAPIDAGMEDRENGRTGLTVGADILWPVARRASVVVTSRYTHVRRSRRASELGIGSSILRFGAGLRVGF